MNAESSRSHSILTLYVNEKNMRDRGARESVCARERGRMQCVPTLCIRTVNVYSSIQACYYVYVYQANDSLLILPMGNRNNVLPPLPPSTPL